jgi:hypothetical protein
MKKIFFFAAAMLAAVTLNAEVRTISFGANDVAAAGELDGKAFSANGFVLTITDKTADGKLKINANNALFGDADAQTKFEYRLQTGGKSSSNNKITLTIPEAGKLYVYARTATADNPRPIVISQYGDELLNATLLDANAISIPTPTEADPAKTTLVHPVYSCDVVAGEAELTYPTNGINIYALSLGGPAVIQGFESVNASAKAVKRVVNGQVVIEREGRLFNLLGAEL